MLKWADETKQRRRKNSTSDADSSSVDPAEERLTNDDNDSLQSPATSIPVQYEERIRQGRQRPRPHSSCCQLYASPEEIVLAWDTNKDVNARKRHSSNNKTSQPNSPTVESGVHILSGSDANAGKKDINTSEQRVATKPELLQISTKQGDKSRHSFWKNLISKRAWPGKTYRTPLRKSHSVVETYRKIEENYYMEPSTASSHENLRKRNSAESDLSYGLADLLIACNTANNNNDAADVQRSRSCRSLKTIQRQNGFKKPKDFLKKSSGSSSSTRSSCRSPDSGFSDIRLSIGEADYGAVPGSPCLSTSSSDGSELYNSER